MEMDGVSKMEPVAGFASKAILSVRKPQAVAAMAGAMKMVNPAVIERQGLNFQ
jgi:hypothetical protein